MICFDFKFIGAGGGRSGRGTYLRLAVGVEQVVRQQQVAARPARLLRVSRAHALPHAAQRAARRQRAQRHLAPLCRTTHARLALSPHRVGTRSAV